MNSIAPAGSRYSTSARPPLTVGLWALPGGLLVLVSGWLFLEHHIFAPYGVLGQVGIAVGTALLALTTVPPGRHRAAAHSLQPERAP